jgi:hypothetical protein
VVESAIYTSLAKGLQILLLLLPPPDRPASGFLSFLGFGALFVFARYVIEEAGSTVVEFCRGNDNFVLVIAIYISISAIGRSLRMSNSLVFPTCDNLFNQVLLIKLRIGAREIVICSRNLNLTGLVVLEAAAETSSIASGKSTTTWPAGRARFSARTIIGIV